MTLKTEINKNKWCLIVHQLPFSLEFEGMNNFWPFLAKSPQMQVIMLIVFAHAYQGTLKICETKPKSKWN